MRIKPVIAALWIGVLAPLALDAQNYTYHPDSNPATGSNNVFPFGNAFGTNWRYQLLIPATNLPTAPTRIRNIAFAPSTTGTFAAGDFELRMQLTTASALSTCFAQNLTNCPVMIYKGSMSYNATANTWSDIPVQSGFAHDGQSNIVLEIRYRQRTQAISSFHTGLTRLWANNITVPTTPDPYTATCARYSATGGIKVRLDHIANNVLIAPPTIQIGTAANVAFTQAPTGFYQIAAAFSDRPIAILGSNLRLALAIDNLFRLSIQSTPLFQNYAGAVAGGVGQGSIRVPRVQALVGVCVYHAAAIYDASGLKAITNSTGTELVP